MDKYLYEETRLRMAHRAKSLGIASLACAAIMFSIPYIAIGLGFLSILFAILSKGYKPHIDKDAKVGMTVGIIGICVGLSVIGTTMYKLVNDAEYRETVTTIIDEVYGDVYEDAFGENFSGILDDLLGGGDGNVDL